MLENDYLQTDVGSHGREKMSMTFTLDEWNSILRHLKNSELYLGDKNLKENYYSICWVSATASDIHDRLEKKIIKLS